MCSPIRGGTLSKMSPVSLIAASCFANAGEASDPSGDNSFAAMPLRARPAGHDARNRTTTLLPTAASMGVGSFTSR